MPPLFGELHAKTSQIIQKPLEVPSEALIKLSTRRLRLPSPHRHEQTVETGFNLREAGALQVFMQLLGRRTFRHVRRAIVRRIMLVVLENGPAFIRTKIGIIDVNPATGP